jgi:diadenylate cyclase
MDKQVLAKEETVKEEKVTKAKAAARESSKDVREAKDTREEKDDSMIDALKMVAPGTRLREGLDSVLRAKTGGLIVIGDSEEIMRLVEGGFELNAEYAPPSLYELAKMDGAIVLSKDAKKILYANAQLIPDPSVPRIMCSHQQSNHKSSYRLWLHQHQSRKTRNSTRHLPY